MASPEHRSRTGQALAVPVSWLCTTALACGLALSACSQRLAPMPRTTPTDAPIAAEPTPTGPAGSGSGGGEPTKPITELSVWLPPDIARASVPLQGRALLYIDALAEAADLPGSVRLATTTKSLLGPAGIVESALATTPVMPERLPDLVLIDAAELQSLVSAGLAQPLDDALPQEAWATFLPFAREAVTVDGTPYGAPLCTDLTLLVYGTEQAPEPPATWQALLRGDDLLLFPAAAGAATSDTLLTLYLSEGGSIEPRDPLIDTTALTRALSAVQLGREAGRIHADAIDTADADQSWAAYATGKADMVVSSSAQLLRGGSQLSGTAFTVVPNSGSQQVSIAHTLAWVILTTNPERQQLAFDLVRASVTDQQQRVLARRTFHLPAVQAAIDAETAGAWHDRLSGQLAVASPAPAFPNYDLLNRSLMWALASVLRGQAGPTEAANLAAVRLSEQQ
ncbi:MAG: extracellular solute-binding protein [Anaerolineae bacterium]